MFRDRKELYVMSIFKLPDILLERELKYPWDHKAIYGGIKGRQKRGLKVNPLYDTTGNQGNNTTQNATQDINGNIDNVHVVTYTSIPAEPQTEDGDKTTVASTIGTTDPNGNDSVDNNSKSEKMYDLTGKNGSIKRQNSVIGNGKHAFKSNVMPVHLGKVEVNGNITTELEVKDYGEHLEGQRKSITSSSYQLLSYCNEGFSIDEKDIDLEAVDDDTNSEGDVNVEDVVLAKETEENQNETVQEIQSVIKPLDMENQENKETYVERNQHSQISKVPNGVQSTETCLNTLTRTSSSYSSTSEQSVRTEIVTKVHVHTVDVNQNHPVIRIQSSSSSDQYRDQQNCHNFESGSVKASEEGYSFATNIVGKEVQEENVINHEHVSILVQHVPDVDTISDGVNEPDTDVANKSTDKSKQSVSEGSKTVSFSESGNQEMGVSNGDKTNSSSTRTIKSILSTSSGKQHSPPSSPQRQHTKQTESVSEIQECKSVTFSEDTVFNENKSKRYKLEKIERINLRDIYHGKISSDKAIAKMNPLFQDDTETAEGERSMSDDERIAYQIALRKMMKSTKGKGSNLNTTAYMDHYLILKANGIQPANMVPADLQVDIEQPAYDRLIQRTIAKERRKLIVKWTLVILTVSIVTAVATVLGVHFKENG